MTRIVAVLISVGLLSVSFIGTAIGSVTGAGSTSVSSVASSLGAPQPLTLAATVGAVLGIGNLPSTSTADATWSLIVLGLVAAALAFAFVRRRLFA
jgi:LPXTG-motif cell wall-anchored protein